MALYADAKERQDADAAAGTARGGPLRLPPPSEISSELRLADQDIVPFSDRQFRADSDLTTGEQERFEDDLRFDGEFADAPSETRRREEGSLLDDEFLRDAGAGAGQSRGLFSSVIAHAACDVLIKVIERRVRRTDHGFYPTIVEEMLRRFYLKKLFEWSWAAMKDSAADAFGPSGGGMTLLDHVKSLRESGDKRRLVLVGHSAGSIWICHLLRKAAALIPGEVFEVVLLAPACTFELFKSCSTLWGRSGSRCAVRDEQPARDD